MYYPSPKERENDAKIQKIYEELMSDPEKYEAWWQKQILLMFGSKEDVLMSQDKDNTQEHINGKVEEPTRI